MKWMLEGEVEVIRNPFEDPPEAEAEEAPSATLYVRVPDSLKRQFEKHAQEDNSSVDVWAMRCMERCIESKSARDIPNELVYIDKIAINADRSDDQEWWDRDRCMKALAEISEIISSYLEDAYGEEAVVDKYASMANDLGWKSIEERFSSDRPDR